MSARNFFSSEEEQQIKDAIAAAEKNTSGEVRVHIEEACKEDVLDHAAYIFKTINMHKTQLRNGVLFYLSVTDHKFAILGDAGINAKVAPDFWDKIKEQMLSDFKHARIAEGLCKGILMAGEQLQSHFPFLQDDVNELTNDISFGEKK